MSNGDSYLHLDGVQSYIEIADDLDFSLPTTGELTISAWIRPATLTFPKSENGYVHWLGKGRTGEQEWVFRMYSADNAVGRANRISFYLFNITGGEGIGSYYQDLNNPVQAGVWLHIVGAADWERTYIYINGTKKDSDVYAPGVRPQRGTAPVRIGTRDFNSYFEALLS